MARPTVETSRILGESCARRAQNESKWCISIVVDDRTTRRLEATDGDTDALVEHNSAAGVGPMGTDGTYDENRPLHDDGGVGSGRNDDNFG